MIALLDIGETVDTMLKEYPSKIRCVQKEKTEYIDPNGLRCKLYVNPGWAYNGTNGEESPVNHFTATESTFAHNQMAYVLWAYMAQNGKLQGVEAQSLDNMNSKKFNDMLITEYNMKFKKAFVSSQEFGGEIYVTNQNLRRTSSGLYLFIEHEFNFENNKAYGTSKAVMRINESERS